MNEVESSGLLPCHEVPPVSVEEMSRKENEGVKLGVSKLMMMENAGNSIARVVLGRSRIGRTKVCLIAGTGNNGGDVFVAARHLSYWADKFELDFFLIGSENDIRSEEALINWHALLNIQAVRRIQIASVENGDKIRKSLESSEIAVVGIFGTGFKGVPRDLARAVIRAINSCKRPTKISVDVPSGLNGDSGDYVEAVVSDYTITMHAPKRGLLKETANQICGEILVANIGLPK